MGKKNSKLKKDTIERLTTSTYCKFLLLFSLSIKTNFILCWSFHIPNARCIFRHSCYSELYNKPPFHIGIYINMNGWTMLVPCVEK